MTSLLDHLEVRVDATASTTRTAADRLRTTMAACRVQFCWFGAKKSLTSEQKARAAETFDADAPFLSAAKKLLDTKHPAFRPVTAVRGRIETFWKAQSLPFPEPGVRLIRQDQIEAFARQMDDHQVELADAVAELDRCYGELKELARERLGSLFHPDDYPTTLMGLFAVSYDFPSVEPPDYLVALAPTLYEQEQERIRARFEEAVELAEGAFLAEFGKLVAHLAERTTGANEDGAPKVFRDSAVNNLLEFFDRFQALNVRSNAQLDELVAEAQRIVRGIDPQDLRDRAGLRRSVSAQLARMQAELDQLLVERPRRRILRQANAPGGP